MTKKTSPQKAKNPLQMLYDSQLSLDERREFAQNVQENLDMSESTFYRYLKAPHKFSTAEKQYIANLAGKKLLQLFPTDI